MRPVALGRKNWLFAGSNEGGKTAAVMLRWKREYKFAKTDAQMDAVESIFKEMLIAYKKWFKFQTDNGERFWIEN